jgi:predicted membrane protein
MENNKYKNHSNRVWSGLILLIIGAVFLLRNFGFNIPYWVFNWPTLLILIGLVIGFKRKFTGGGWLVMILIGGYFTLQNIADFNLTQYYIGTGFILLGLFVIFRPGKPYKDRFAKKFRDHNWADEMNIPADPLNLISRPCRRTYDNENDFIDAVNVFSGSKRQVYSKNLKGGDIVSVFGGCDLDLTQADFQDNVSIDIVAIFGGVKLIIPPSWVVRSEISPIFGGLDDKRAVTPVTGEPIKIITIKGVAIFGGVSISNY